MSRATKRQNLAYEQSKRPTNTKVRTALIIFLTILALLLVGATTIRHFLPTEEPPIQSNSWDGVTPGYVLTPKLNQQLGEPVRVQNLPAEKQKVFYKNDGFKIFYNEVILNKDGVVEFIKTPVSYDESNLFSNYITEHGLPDFELYVPDAGLGKKAYVYLEKGLVYVAHEDKPVIEQIWYFEPTDRNTFMLLWGTSLSEDQKYQETFPF